MTAKTPDGKCVCGSWLGDYDQCLAGCDGSGSDPTPSGCGYDESTNPSNGWRAPEGSATPEEIRDADGFLVLYDNSARPDLQPSREAAEMYARNCREATGGNVEARVFRFADVWDLGSRVPLAPDKGTWEAFAGAEPLPDGRDPLFAEVSLRNFPTSDYPDVPAVAILSGVKDDSTVELSFETETPGGPVSYRLSFPDRLLRVAEAYAASILTPVVDVNDLLRDGFRRMDF